MKRTCQSPTHRHAMVMNPGTPTAVQRMAGGLHHGAQRSHEETALSEIIGSRAKPCRQRGGKTKKKVTLDGDEMWSIIRDVGPEYKDDETPKKTVCSTASNWKFDATLSVVRTPR